jgi:hypothetical protein
MQSRQIRGRQTYPTNETNIIGGVKTDILQSIDAILAYIFMRCGQKVANSPHPHPLTEPTHCIHMVMHDVSLLPTSTGM